MPSGIALDLRVTRADASQFVRRGDPALPAGNSPTPPRDNIGIMVRQGREYLVIFRETKDTPNHQVSTVKLPDSARPDFRWVAAGLTANSLNTPVLTSRKVSEANEDGTIASSRRLTEQFTKRKHESSSSAKGKGHEVEKLSTAVSQTAIDEPRKVRNIYEPVVTSCTQAHYPQKITSNQRSAKAQVVKPSVGSQPSNKRGSAGTSAGKSSTSHHHTTQRDEKGIIEQEQAAKAIEANTRKRRNNQRGYGNEESVNSGTKTHRRQHQGKPADLPSEIQSKKDVVKPPSTVADSADPRIGRRLAGVETTAKSESGEPEKSKLKESPPPTALTPSKISKKHSYTSHLASIDNHSKEHREGVRRVGGSHRSKKFEEISAVRTEETPHCAIHITETYIRIPLRMRDTEMRVRREESTSVNSPTTDVATHTSSPTTVTNSGTSSLYGLQVRGSQQDRKSNRASETPSWAYSDPSSVVSTRGGSPVPNSFLPSDIKTRASTLGEISTTGRGSTVPSSQTSSASVRLSFPVFIEKTWHLLRKADPSLPSFKKAEHFGDHKDRDTDLWLGLHNPIVVKLPSTTLLAHIPVFRDLLTPDSHFCLGKGGLPTPRYALCISVNESRALEFSAAAKLRDPDAAPADDHTRHVKHNLLDFFRALHGRPVRDVANLRSALQRVQRYFDCPAAVARCLRSVERGQAAALEAAVRAEPRECLRFGHRYGAARVFEVAFGEVARRAARERDGGAYLRGVPSAVRDVVEMKVGMLRSVIDEDTMWKRAWQAMDGEQQMPSDVS